MQSQEICQILKQILPELEAKIKQDLKNQYQLKIHQIQQHYHQEMVQLANRHKQITRQLTAEYENRYLSNQNDDKEKQELYKRVSMLQAQRKNWNDLQSQYQLTIQNLTKQLTNFKAGENTSYTKQLKEYQCSLAASSVSNDFCSISPIPPPTTQIKYSFPVSKWNHRQKNNDNEENIGQSFKKDKIIKQQKNQSNVKKEESSSKQSLQKQDWASKYLNQEETYAYANNKSHYHSVLSPPKQCVVKPKKLLWDENKKKQLLSMIKLS